MDIELIEIVDFISKHPPFSLLSYSLRESLPSRMEISYMRRGQVILQIGHENTILYIIRSGAVEMHSPDGELLQRLGEGEVFGAQALLHGGRVHNQVVVIEDSLFYRLPKEDFDRLCREEYLFADFFVPQGADRLRVGLRNIQPILGRINLATARIGDIPLQKPVTALPSTRIRHAAEKMLSGRTSALILRGEESLQGIVTDRDLSTRVIAAGLSPDLPVATVMTPHPITADKNDYVFDVMLSMVSHNINHLPVMDGPHLVGLLTSQDLFSRQQGSSPVRLVGQISRIDNLEDLRAAVQEAQLLLVSMVSAHATAQSMERILTHLTDAVTVRLLRMAEEKLGQPPVPYAWMAAGSQGRQEQGVQGDQDNFLIIDDRFDPQEHEAYFDALSRFVCDGLNECGYIYCPGDMMAANRDWRLPLQQWRKRFAVWIDEPSPKALMLTCIFFDLRLVHGEKPLSDALHGYILEKVKGNRVFLAHMTVNALSRQPPLGFFRNLVLQHSGEHDETLDLKIHGVIPIVDLARIYALEAGLPEVNTHERLHAASQMGSVSQGSARDLDDALEFIAFTRLRHQANRLHEGKPVNNFLPPKELSDLERNHLKDAFKVVKTLQRALALHHQVSRIS
ncbi:MAG: cyclic nucleotide-binding/CBS domain-containing protein [Magnetococcales bacterium]|nr:cyclic nucleotide-binding/CBS domain-containing protein [Magnetococcales bacterium]